MGCDWMGWLYLACLVPGVHAGRDSHHQSFFILQSEAQVRVLKVEVQTCWVCLHRPRPVCVEMHIPPAGGAVKPRKGMDAENWEKQRGTQRSKTGPIPPGSVKVRLIQCPCSLRA